MASLPIHWIAARTYCQVTEEEDRVVKALDTTIIGGAAGRDALEGQFGNPVVVLMRRVERAEGLRATWARWREAGLLAALKDDLEARLDADGILHFRLDKESAFAGALTPARGTDPIDIQVKLKAYPASPEEVRRVARSLMEEAA
jgi:RNA binding exosome subunit